MLTFFGEYRIWQRESPSKNEKRLQISEDKENGNYRKAFELVMQATSDEILSRESRLETFVDDPLENPCQTRYDRTPSY